MPKLTSLTTVNGSSTFYRPRSITLEGMSYHSVLTSRHALFHHCYSYRGHCFQTQFNRSYKESLSLLSLIPRHHSRSPTVFPVPCFFHILIPTPNRRFHFTQQLLLSFLITTIAILTGISHVMLSSDFPFQLSHFIVIPDINPNTIYASSYNH